MRSFKKITNFNTSETELKNDVLRSLYFQNKTQITVKSKLTQYYSIVLNN